MIKGIAALIALLAIGTAQARSFCDNVPFVQFDQLTREKDRFRNSRVQTHGLLITDGKHATLIKQSEPTKLALRVGDDGSESEKYARVHGLPVHATFNTIPDLVDTLKRRGIA